MAAGTTGIPSDNTRPVGAQIAREQRGVDFRGQQTEPAFDWNGALKNSAIAAALAAVLAFFLIGISTDIAPGGLVIRTRWLGYCFAVGLVFLGRLLLETYLLRSSGLGPKLITGALFAVAIPLMLGFGVAGNGQTKRILIGFGLGLVVVGVLFVISEFKRKRGLFVSGGAADSVGLKLRWVPRALGLSLFAFAVILPFFFTYFFPGRDRYYIDLAILIMTYIMLGWGLNIVVGLAGLLDLGYVAFYAVGA